MQQGHFIQDLATVMLVAGVTTVLCLRLRQPVVLGYIVAGFLVGPHSLPVLFIHDESTIHTLSWLGMILLLFVLGLEFNIKKLHAVGSAPLWVACGEIALMLWIGYEIGRLFQWSMMNALFLGALMSISSTAIIVKALEGLGLKRGRFAELVFGILIVEDILAIVLLALLTGIAKTGDLAFWPALSVLGKLALFMAVSLVLGLLLVPRLIDYVSRVGQQEVLLVAVLGLLFGFCLLVSRLGYSVALGAFMIGVMVGEARSAGRVERIVMPLRDMFSAIFFVAIGMLLDPLLLWRYALPVAVITVAVIGGKVLACGLGSFLAGTDGRTSLRIGLGLAQIGEFSFIIASLGLTLKVTSEFLYPVAVAVSSLTTLFTPYLIRSTDCLVNMGKRYLPAWLIGELRAYTAWIARLTQSIYRAQVLRMVQRLLWHVLINICLVVGLFVGMAALYRHGLFHVWGDAYWPQLQRSLAWSLAALLSLPMVVAAYRKAMALGMLLAELALPVHLSGSYYLRIRNLVARLVPLAVMWALALLVVALASAILPPRGVALALLLLGLGLTAWSWRFLVRVHARLQMALRDTVEKTGRSRRERLPQDTGK